MRPGPDQSFDAIQFVQEQEYEFPYHYIPRRDARGASTCIRWHWGLDYLVGLDVAMHHLVACNPNSFLDIGCGDGRFLRDVRQRTQIGELLGVDYSARAIALARALNPSLRYEQFDVTAASLPTQYDAAALIEVVEHIPPASMNEFLAGVRRCIRSGGALVVTVPHSNMPVAKKHYQHFTSETLRSVLERHFRVERIVPFGHMPRMVRVAANLAGYQAGEWSSTVLGWVVGSTKGSFAAAWRGSPSRSALGSSRWLALEAGCGTSMPLSVDAFKATYRRPKSRVDCVGRVSMNL